MVRNNRRKDMLKFLLEDDRDAIDEMLGRIDELTDDALDDIFVSDRRDGIKSRVRKKIFRRSF